MNDKPLQKPCSNYTQWLYISENVQNKLNMFDTLFQIFEDI